MITDTFVEAIAQRVAELIRPVVAHPVVPRLLTVDEAAIYLARTDKAVRHLIATGAIPAVRSDARVMLDRNDLDHFIEKFKS